MQTFLIIALYSFIITFQKNSRSCLDTSDRRTIQGVKNNLHSSKMFAKLQFPQNL